MLKIAYVSLLVAIGVSVLVGWRLSMSAKLPEIPTWRRRLLLLGLIGNAASLIVFLAAVFQPALMSKGVNIQDYRLFFPFAVVSVLLGAFGRRVPRILVILNGLVLTLLWLDLAASSL
ncbi:MAG: hypothetical protein DMG22_02765 [Acidobacteria bacterium]|nr:MAG: hypothetical protein DMG22_02765 [Acidobacteriota bacterium]